MFKITDDDSRVILVKNGKLGIFLVNSMLPELEIYKTDGNSFELVKKCGGYIRYINEIKDKLFFALSDAVISSYTLWVSDGTIEGTHQFYETVKLSPFTHNFNPIVINDKLYFASDNFEYSSGQYMRFCSQIWESNLTTEGTFIVSDIPTKFRILDMIESKGIIYFKGSDSTGAYSLWKFNPNKITSIQQNLNSSISNLVIYPNPFEYILYIEVDGNKKFQFIQLFNGTGEICFEQRINFNETKVKLDLSNLNIPKGLYYLKIDGYVKGFKVVKSN